MDLRQRWIIARQDKDTDWEFFADRGQWTSQLHEAVLFYTLWGAEEAWAHSAAGYGKVHNARAVRVGCNSRPIAGNCRDRRIGALYDMRHL